MKKTFLRNGMAFVAILAVAALLLLPREGHSMAEMKLLEVVGTFEALDDTVEPNIVILSVNGQEASGPLFNSCRFFGEKEENIDKETFVQRYLKRVITVEIIEETGEVFSCRI
jgi:hypothetical protein